MTDQNQPVTPIRPAPSPVVPAGTPVVGVVVPVTPGVVPVAFVVPGGARGAPGVPGVQRQEEDERIAKLRVDAIRQAFSTIADQVYGGQILIGEWSPEKTVEENDEGLRSEVVSYFSDLHASVSKAYDSFRSDEDVRTLTWSDPVTGEAVEPAKGMPEGLAADLAEVACMALGLIRRLGIDAGVLMANIHQAQNLFVDSDPLKDFGEDEGVTDEDEEEESDEDET